MNIIVAILSAIAALAGPFRDILTTVWQDVQTFHTNGDVTPDQLALQALQIAPQAISLVADVKQQISIVATALQESNNNLTPAHAVSVAAAAVSHVSK